MLMTNPSHRTDDESVFTVYYIDVLSWADLSVLKEYEGFSDTLPRTLLKNLSLTTCIDNNLGS